MSWTVSYSTSAARAIRRLDPQIRQRVRRAIEVLVEDPLRGKALHLSLKGLRSWRTGDFRIVYRLSEGSFEILIVAVGHRREVYERLRDQLKK
jgi:mRNA interferase RelE/StbE